MSDDVCCQMPRYRCHKEVFALKIKAIEPGHFIDGGATVIPVEEGYAPFKVTEEYLRKHNPQAGGYYVVYDDGYKSWSPEKAFEEGYTRIS